MSCQLLFGDSGVYNYLCLYFIRTRKVRRVKGTKVYETQIESEPLESLLCSRSTSDVRVAVNRLKETGTHREGPELDTTVR